jgi:hypothetical protein
MATSRTAWLTRAKRDSARYRTPYAAWGGFTNGYEGDLRAHLMRTQSSGTSGDILGAIPQNLLQPLDDAGLTLPQSDIHGVQETLLAPSLMPAPLGGMVLGGSEAARRLAPANAAGYAPLHPAIRPQFTTAWQRSTGPTATPKSIAAPLSDGQQTVAMAAMADLAALGTNEAIDTLMVDSKDHDGLADVPPDWTMVVGQMLMDLEKMSGVRRS